ncbi:MAG: metal-dependent hydrolase [Deltaproteobacteria bacterium]|nr:metal-dependent hydrolase [Deltaproteobacteria bacterium]
MRIYGASYILPMNAPPVPGGGIAVDQGRIVAVGRLADLRQSFAAPVEEYPDCILMPGLVNAHTHLELTHFPAWRLRHGLHYSPRSYVDWIIQVIKVKRTLSLAELSASLLEGLKISLQSGTTMVGDFLSDRRLLPFYENAAISGRIYLEFIGQDPSRYAHLLADLDEDVFQLPSPFLAGLAPHAPFTVSGELLQSLLETARHKGLPLAMHLAESAAESGFFRDTSGGIAADLYPFVGWHDYLPAPQQTTPTGWLAAANALSADFLAVHGVHLEKADLELLKAAGSAVVLLPRSNENLAVGRAPAAALLQAGIPLALGTDSLASSDSLSLWDEMRFLLDSFPQLFAPVDAVRMATVNAAAAIKRDGDAGSLEPGKQADFLVIQPQKLPAAARLYEQLLDHARVVGVWCAGKKVVTS